MSSLMFSPYKWAGNATFAAITAVVSANIVLVAYIITSVLEDKQVSIKNLKEKSEGKKDKWILNIYSYPEAALKS